MRSASVEWLIVGAAAILAILAGSYRGRAFAAGDTRVVNITLTPSDRENLACAAKPFRKGVRCAFERVDGPKSAALDQVVPVVTTDGELLLAKGILSAPKVKRRLGSSTKKGEPLVVRCEVALLERLPSVPIRFERSHRFQRSESAWLVEAKHCH